MHYGLLGEHLAHSFSPQIHAKLANLSYDLCEIPPQNLDIFIKKRDFSGLNITIPYKKSVMPYCAELSPIAREIGSVNTIIKLPNGSLFGDNTDYFGMAQMLSLKNISLKNKHILILGTGGSSLTAQHLARRSESKSILVCSRKSAKNCITYENLQLAKNAQIIINTTPVGMFPICGKSPINLNDFPFAECVVDLIYNPQFTDLLLQARAKNLKTAGGLAMLVYQAAAASALFCGTDIALEKAHAVYTELCQSLKNIVLIGMPGSGKTTVGCAIAKKLNRDFIDTDAQIEAREKMPISQIFAQKGEQYFRALERKIVAECGALQGRVIATGGGCVLDAQNYAPLAQNGIVFRLIRPLSLLSTANRPLSASMPELIKMQAFRAPLYNKFADFSIDNSGEIANTVQQLEEKFNENSCY